MSLLINGMHKPKYCGDCFVGDKTICQDGCPLVEIPEHERLIDADRQTEWIPCEERLPEVEVRVLTCYSQGFVETNFLLDDTEKSWMYGNDLVVAWMPLPRPYER